MRESVTAATSAVVNIADWSWFEGAAGGGCCGCGPVRPRGGRMALTAHRSRRSSDGAILLDRVSPDAFYELSSVLYETDLKVLTMRDAHSRIRMRWICT